jgi:hypothetical protein
MITDLFQPPRDGPLQHSHDGVHSYPRGCDICSFEHLDLPCEENFQPYLCLKFNEKEVVIFSRQWEIYTTYFQPYSLSSSFQDPVRNHVSRDDFSMGRVCFQLKVFCMNL